MSDFFRVLVSNNLMNDWAKVLDWIFDDNRFSKEHGWTSGYVGSFTKKLKKLEGFEKGYAQVKSDYLNYPIECKQLTFIANFSGESEARGIVRHIRNGIAHGKTSYKKIPKKNGELFIEIKDYKENGTTQTAYILIPVRYIVEIHNIYLETEKSIKNCKQAGRRKVKRKSKQ